AHEALQETALANARYKLAATDYFNSYYGRLALPRLDAATRRQLVASGRALDGAASSRGAPAFDGEDAPIAAPPPNERLVRALLGLGLYDQAIGELQYAQKVWGSSPAIEATLAWIYQKQGQSEK